jgi:hypothetical protein
MCPAYLEKHTLSGPPSYIYMTFSKALAFCPMYIWDSQTIPLYALSLKTHTKTGDAAGISTRIQPSILSLATQKCGIYSPDESETCGLHIYAKYLPSLKNRHNS